MKSKLILGLALVLGGISLISSTVAQSISNSVDGLGFPTSMPIPNANPSLRRPLLVHVPTKVKIERTADMLSIGIDNKSSLDATKLMVGTNMMTGVQSEVYVYPLGEARPAPRSEGLDSGLDFNLGTQILHTKPDGMPVPGVKYLVEMDLTVFETDISVGHDWEPVGKNYKVLWRRTLKQIVE